MKATKRKQAPMNLAIPDVRTLEVHLPTFGHFTSCRRSDGSGRNELGVPLLQSAIRDAARLGYNFLSVAGEQSVFYPELNALCREAHHARMLTTLTTRAGLLSARRLKSLVHSIDLLGIRYEAGMARNLEPVRSSGIPFALVFHLTGANIGELESTAAFAATHGAAMLHVQPAEELSESDMATVWMMIECLRDIHRGGLALQLDAVNRYNLRSDADDLDAWLQNVSNDPNEVGERISPLVIEEDGFVVPLRHGFPRILGLGSLHAAELETLVRSWVRESAAGFCEAFRHALHDSQMFADLYQLLAREATRRTTPRVVAMRMVHG
jgi:hypothetical protein